MSFVNNLSRDKQIEVIAALCEGVGIRTAARLTGVNRGTVGSLALRVGLGCMELHDRLMVGIRTERPGIGRGMVVRRQEAKERPAPRNPSGTSYPALLSRGAGVDGSGFVYTLRKWV